MKRIITHDANNTPRTPSGVLRFLAFGGAVLMIVVLAAFPADNVPTDIKFPGTQPTPTDNPPTLGSFGNCGCHNFSSTVNPVPDVAPVIGWHGGMMANAGRDPLFWSTVAVAEQDFLPEPVWVALGGDPGQMGGVGDLCLKCHTPKGWFEGRSTPTDGSGMDPATDDEGVACELCHFMADPDEDETPPGMLGKNAEYAEEQNYPFEAFDPVTGDGYYGGAELVLNSFGDRIGPYQAEAKHPWVESPYFRDGRFCGTCHDVSNSAVGDLAHNHGSQAPFTGPFSGIPNGDVTTKAALNNPPHTYGIVERTFSEWIASDIDTWEVNNFSALPTTPVDMQVAGGALDRAYQAALHGFCSVTTDDPCNVDANCPSGETCLTTTANFADGSTRYYTCQTCHMSPTGGKAAQNGPFRPDAPRHDLTGGSYWVADAVMHQYNNGTLRFGTSMSVDQIDGMNAGKARAEEQLRSAAALSASQVGPDLGVTVTNLTGHKLITGYPEGRRMWLNIQWYDGPDGTGSLVSENGAYGPIGVTVQDRAGTSWDVESIIDLDSTEVYQATPGMTQEWASQLTGLGYDPGMVLSWDRYLHIPEKTIGQLAAESPGTEYHTFHFVLNNVMHHDNRIPPLGYDYDKALERNAMPVPDSQFGDPGPGGTFDNWDVENFHIPVGAQSAVARLYYQSTSWEYIQFLWKQNQGTFAPGSDPPCDTVAFLGCEGVNMLDAWLNTSMTPPFEMASTTVSVTPQALNPPSGAGYQEDRMEVVGYDPGTGAISLTYGAACDAGGHTIHYGPLIEVGTLNWAEADCTLDGSGAATFIPDPAVGDSIFWVIVGNNIDWEGTYGADSDGIERPPNTASAGSCFRPQNLAQVCM